MNVIHVLPFPGVGGTEVATLRVMDAVAAYGVTNRALLLEPTVELRRFLDAGKVTAEDAPVVPQPSLRRGLRFARDCWRLARELRRRNASLVHCADILAAYHVAAACRLASIPVISHVRNRYRELPSRERLMVNAANHFIFVSKETRNHFAIGVPQARTSVVYDGIEVPPFEEPQREAVAREVRQEFHLSGDTIVASMFARVAPQKDYETLIRAAALITAQHPRLVFLIVGDHAGTPEHRTHYAHVQQLIDQAGLTSRFVFAGFRKDARRLMMGSDICLLSTNWEGLPLVLLESMAVARPVIATEVDGIPEIVIPNVTGLLYPHRDAEALASHLRALLADPARARQLGEGSREHVRQHFSRERFGRELHELYTRLARPAQLSSAKRS